MQRCPALRSSYAAVSPAMPAPMTTTWRGRPPAGRRVIWPARATGRSSPRAVAAACTAAAPPAAPTACSNWRREMRPSMEECSSEAALYQTTDAFPPA